MLHLLTSLGEIYAEDDFRPEFFVPSSAWDAVWRRDKVIVVGRKGTGKTALGYVLETRRLTDASLFVKRLDFGDYPFNVHNAIFDTGVGNKGRFLQTWLFLIQVELAKLAVGEDQAPASSDRAEARAAVESFVKQHWGSLQFDYRDTFAPREYEVTKTFKPSVAGFSVGGADWKQVARNRLGDSLSEMNRWLQHALVHAMRQDATYFLVFDRLDLDFDPSNATYLDSIIGLVRAAAQVHTWAQENELRAVAIVLLRDDLYEALQFSDKNKITQRLVARLNWSAEPDAPDGLVAMIEARIGALLDEAGSAVPEGERPWHLIFAPDTAGGRSHAAHVVDRSFLRPRDVIKFCNLALDEARRRAGSPTSDDRITAADLDAAANDYGVYFREELRDEVFAHQPEVNAWLELLRRVGTRRFTLKSFEAECKQSRKLLADASALEVLDIFYTFGIVGCEARTGKDGTVTWRYASPQIPFDVGAPAFHVHPGLWANLGLT